MEAAPRHDMGILQGVQGMTDGWAKGDKGWTLPAIIALRERIGTTARNGVDGTGGRLYRIVWLDTMDAMRSGVQLAYDAMVENGVKPDDRAVAIVASLIRMMEEEAVRFAGGPQT
jgi:hypothetical protein